MHENREQFQIQMSTSTVTILIGCDEIGANHVVSIKHMIGHKFDKWYERKFDCFHVLMLDQIVLVQCKNALHEELGRRK